MGANSITSPRLTLPQAYSENNGLEKKNEIMKMRFEIVFADVSNMGYKHFWLFLNREISNFWD